MPRCPKLERPMATCARQALAAQKPSSGVSSTARRLLSSTATRQDATTTTTTATPTTPTPPLSTMTSDLAARQQAYDAFTATLSERSTRMQRVLDPNTTTSHWGESMLMKKGILPIGSRRRRAAVKLTTEVPFEQLPYQCFQDARKILAEDREEKLVAIRAEVEKIKRLEATDASAFRNGQYHKDKRLDSLRRHVEDLKILADINDPMVKKRWEDGLGDMSKPIYRHLTHRKWLSMAYKVLKQRVDQLYIVPDVLPRFDPKMDVQLFFRQIRIEPGEIVDSLVSEVPPRLRVQTFDNKKRLMTIVVMDSDVPLPDQDTFGRRCHYLAANIPLDPIINSIPLGQLSRETQIAVPWLPAFGQKGAPYHRLSIFLCEQKDGQELDVAKLRETYSSRDGFSLKSFKDKFGVTPYGFNVFRTKWDSHTEAVMERHGIPGADVEFRRKRVHSLKPHRKARGWEAKRMGPKYRHLWKYTHRIA